MPLASPSLGTAKRQPSHQLSSGFSQRGAVASGALLSLPSPILSNPQGPAQACPAKNRLPARAPQLSGTEPCNPTLIAAHPHSYSDV